MINSSPKNEKNDTKKGDKIWSIFFPLWLEKLYINQTITEHK